MKVVSSLVILVLLNVVYSASVQVRGSASNAVEDNRPPSEDPQSVIEGKNFVEKELEEFIELLFNSPFYGMDQSKESEIGSRTPEDSHV